MIETSIDDLLAKIMRSVENNSITVSKGVVDAFNLGCAFAAIKAIDEKAEQEKQVIEPIPVSSEEFTKYLEDFWDNQYSYGERSEDDRMVSVSLKAENLEKFDLGVRAFKNNSTRYFNNLVARDFQQNADIYRKILSKYPIKTERKRAGRPRKNKKNSNEVADVC